ncbi:transmembrane and immunoglobulin domain-containing protein 1 isoform X2 [Betta splendens]|uniref:transmembrane and immunoglobulin domain-containing protein 1 isoform X2 n=1 Tax=Betta splendens TaxID=158456 RepID=UPI0010F479EF|nr:transmembrane and immunoglobulin domain-containing protein 1 isoform X2 [Betta splendens]
MWTATPAARIRAKSSPVYQREKMKFMLSLPLFSLLFLCAAQTLGVKIQSSQPVNSAGVIHTELEQTVSLLCMSDSHSGAPDDELVWLRNDELVQLKEENKKGKSSVCVTPVLLDDNGATFTCRLSTNATDTTSVTLKVTYGPQLSGSEEVTAEEESTLVLKCNIFANPPVSSVSWTLNGSLVDLQAGGLTVVNDGRTSQLTARSLRKGLHEGTYLCTAQSPMYGNYSRSFTVTVQEKTVKFPLIPLIAGLVVVFLTSLLAVVSRWKKIIKCCK